MREAITIRKSVNIEIDSDEVIKIVLAHFGADEWAKLFSRLDAVPYAFSDLSFCVDSKHMTDEGKSLMVAIGKLAVGGFAAAVPDDN